MELNQLVIGIKGAGEMASAVAWRLYTARIHRIFMLEISNPLAVRREVSFCEAVYDGQKVVEHVKAVRIGNPDETKTCWQKGELAVLVDPEWRTIPKLRPDVVVDAVLAKRNLGTGRGDAKLVIGLGPGFSAGNDVHMVIETNRGHHLGRIITAGSAEANTGIPGAIGGYAEKRVLRAPGCGEFSTGKHIGDLVKSGDLIGRVATLEVRAGIDGVLRGLLRNHSRVSEGLKIGDIDPRAAADYCYTISDKARAIAGSVLEAILRVYN
jgi:xanthine dehydrogenase accessory factor